MNGYTGTADGFHVNVHLITQMELPNNRDTVLHFFEQMRKAFPELRHFFKRENGDLVLESEKERESQRWLAIQPRRLCSGQFNPETMDDAFRQHELLLDLAPHLLTISTLDCEAVEIMYEFDFHYDGNHDEVVAEAIGVGQGLEGLFELPKSQVVKFEPSLILALDETGGLQCQLLIENHTSSAPPRGREFLDDQISVYFTLRRYWGSGPETTFLESVRRQRQIGEELLEQSVVPRVVRPLAQAIASH
jgi:hypothetical protein